MARLVIGVDVVGQKDVEALSVSLNNADTALKSWFRTSNAAGRESNVVASLTVTQAVFKKLEQDAVKATAAVSAFFRGGNSTFTAQAYAQAAALEKMDLAYKSLINTYASQILKGDPGVQRLLDVKKAIEDNMAAYNKLQSMGTVSGRYDKNEDYSYKLVELKKIEELDAKIAANEAKRASMQAKNEAEIVAALKAEEKARQEVALATIKQFEAERLLSGTGPTNISKVLKSAVVYAPVGAETAREAAKGTTAIGKLGDAWDNAGKKSRNFHDLMRGASGAMGTLWLTYGQLLPMLAGFATVSAGMKTFSIGSELDYTARSIEVLSYGYKTLESNADLANKSLAGTKEALLGIQDSPFSANQLGEGVLEFARAGYKDLEENIKGVDAASKFAYIGQMDLAKAIELVVGEMSAFKGITADAALNTMAIVADRTSINLQQMGEAFKNATSLGTVLGLEFNDVATAIGVMGQAGIRGATAGAALNTMMYKLIAPTEKAQKQMDALGITFKAFDDEGKIKSIRDIAFELANMTKGLKPNEVGKVFESMVGLRGVKALGALVQMAKESSKEFDDLSKAVQNSEGYLDGYFKLLEKSGKVQYDLLKSNISNIFAGAYTESEPAILESLKSLNDLAKDKSVVEFVSFLTTSMASLIKIVADGTRAIIDFGAALNNIIPIKEPIEATLAGIANKFEQVAKLAKLYKEGSAGAVFTAPEDTFSYGEFNAKSIKEAADQTAKLAEEAKNAKAELAKINGVGVTVFSKEEADKLGTIEEYFDNIRDKIIDANKTPLQLIDSKVQQDAENYFATLVQGGMSLDKMIELTETYKRQIREVGGAGSTAAEKIEEISKSLKDAGGDAGKIKQLTGNLQDLAKAANAKELEKANKQIISGLKKEWQSYADKVIDIQDKIADHQRTLASELRAIDQSNMTGMQLWKDKKKEVEEYKASAIDAAKKAAEAFKSGDKTAGDKYFGLSEDYFKSAIAAAKQLNTEVTGDTTALNNLVTSQERAITRLESARTQKGLLGGDTSAYDAAIERQEKILQAYKSSQAAAEATVLQSKQRSSEITKQEITDVTNANIAAQKQMQDAQLDGMKKVQEQANSAAGGKEVDLTAGMDANKAKFITDWLETKDTVVKGLVSATDTVTLEMMNQIRSRVQMPSEDWTNSIFGMKGMFVQAVDEMSKKLETDLFKGVSPSLIREKIGSLDAFYAARNAEAPAVELNTEKAMAELDKLQAKITELKSDGVTEADEESISKIQDLMTTYLADIIKANESAGKSNDELFKKYSESREATFEATIEGIESIYGKMSELVNTDWTINVNVSGAGADLIGKKDGGLIGGYTYGGAIQALANGGNVRDVLGGAYLPGFGGGDRRLLLGEDGEVMINKWSTKKGGVDTALAYNNSNFDTVVNNLVNRGLTSFNPNGIIENKNKNKNTHTVVWKFGDTGESATVKTTAVDLDIIQRGLKRRERLRS